ncbi:MAG: PH domain-containing protein [Ruminococcaceae bacterium]|nr:PH domain-containing protein [Oscillospiraceae bacterium]
MAVNIEYLWKDRRRRMGMPLSFTKYALSDDRIFLEKGLLNMNEEEVQLYRVRDISLSITLWQRIFGMGTITIQSNDKTHPTLEIKNVLHPREVKEMIHDQVETVRKERNVGVSELLNDDMDLDL